MTFRDTSADRTLTNANEGIMSSDFEKWWKESGIEFASIFETGAAKKGWNARQPEIDALKEDNKHISENLEAISSEANTLEEENSHLEDELVKLKAENGRLREDAERYRRLRGQVILDYDYMTDFTWLKFPILKRIGNHKNPDCLDDKLDAMKDFSTQPKEE